jgi:hypothetical protein
MAMPDQATRNAGLQRTKAVDRGAYGRNGGHDWDPGGVSRTNRRSADSTSPGQARDSGGQPGVSRLFSTLAAAGRYALDDHSQEANHEKVPDAR